ncbi:hypothetical protein [Kitasatospora aureofaciens]
MTHTAPAPSPAELAAAVPGLAEYLRPATLLNPYAAQPVPGASGIGGPALWAVGAPWPHCTARHPEDEYLIPRSAPVPPTVPTALITLAHLRAEDAPHLPWPEGTDLLQVLWCPNDHDDI